MAGLSRFDMYPRDWISGTRELSDRARGAYIDLLCRMYDLGRHLDHDERELCRFLGYRDHRQLRPVLDELITKGKIILDGGKLFNARTMREIEAAQQKIAAGKKGGRPRKSGTSEAPARHQRASSDHFQGASIEENQGDNKNPPSPSPSPSKYIPPTEGAEAPLDPKKAVFDFGKSILPGKSGGQIKRLIDYHHSDLSATMATLRLASGKSDPAEYVGAILKGGREPETDWNAEYRRMGVSL